MKALKIAFDWITHLEPQNISLISDILVALAAISIPFIILHYEKKRDDHRKKVEQMEIIAELLATWARYPTNDHISRILSIREEREFFNLLNSLSYKASIWVPNKELLLDLKRTLTHGRNALSPKDLIVKIRKEIQGEKGEDITPGDIVTFGREL